MASRLSSLVASCWEASAEFGVGVVASAVFSLLASWLESRGFKQVCGIPMALAMWIVCMSLWVVFFATSAGRDGWALLKQIYMSDYPVTQALETALWVPLILEQFFRQLRAALWGNQVRNDPNVLIHAMRQGEVRLWRATGAFGGRCRGNVWRFFTRLWTAVYEYLTAVSSIFTRHWAGARDMFTLYWERTRSVLTQHSIGVTGFFKAWTLPRGYRYSEEKKTAPEITKEEIPIGDTAKSLNGESITSELKEEKPAPSEPETKKSKKTRNRKKKKPKAKKPEAAEEQKPVPELNPTEPEAMKVAKPVMKTSEAAKPVTVKSKTAPETPPETPKPRTINGKLIREQAKQFRAADLGRRLARKAWVLVRPVLGWALWVIVMV